MKQTELSRIILVVGTFAMVGAFKMEAQDAPLTPPVPAAVATTGPRIQFDDIVFDFGKLTGGEMAKHTFTFTNTGDATLEIKSVHPACGCTTSGEWTKTVEPGGTGTIPIGFNSGSFSGNIHKTVMVSCNDSTQPNVTLQIKGFIWKPVDVTPQYAVLPVNSESVSNATVSVRVVNNMDMPLEAFEPEVGNRNFAVTLKTNTPGKEFELVVRPVPPLDLANTQGAITLKTSATNVPTVSVIAMVMMQPSVMAMPAQVMLPGGKLTEPWSSTVTLRNQLNAPLQLSEPAVSVKDIGFSIKELEPGRVYNVEFTLPAGFEMSAGTSAEFTVKSSHADSPQVRIPLIPTPSQAGAVSPGRVAIAPRAVPVLQTAVPAK